MKKNIVILLGLGLQVLPFVAGDGPQKPTQPELVSFRAIRAARALGELGSAQAPEGVELPGAVPSFDRVPSDDRTWAPVGQGVGAQQVRLFARQSAFLASSYAGSEMILNPAVDQGAQAAPGAGVGGHLFSLKRPSKSSADDAQIYRAGSGRLSLCHAGNERLPRVNSGDQHTQEGGGMDLFASGSSLAEAIHGDAQAAAQALGVQQEAQGVPAAGQVGQAAPRRFLDCCSIQ